MNRRAQGAEWEDRAADMLRAKGYVVVTRRWKGPRGEIDVIAMHGDCLVFVEVKARFAGDSPEIAVDKRKLRAMDAAAGVYREEVEWGDRPWRWDLVAVDGEGMRHYVDAFRA